MHERANERIQEIQIRLQNAVTSAEIGVMVDSIENRIQEIMRRLEGFASRDTVMAEYTRITSKIDEIAKAQTLSTGKGAGLTQGWGLLVAVFGLIATIVGMYFLIRGGG